MISLYLKEDGNYVFYQKRLWNSTLFSENYKGVSGLKVLKEGVKKRGLIRKGPGRPGPFC
jgi:hypothetical protein